MRKVSRGKGFLGVLRYVIERDNGRGGIVVGGNMSGSAPGELATEFLAARRLRPDIEKPVWHQALRLPAGERVSNQRWDEIGDEYMRRMGFGDLHQRAYILHDDEDGQHIHIVANRVELDGSIYLGQNENLKSTQIVRQLEVVFGLNITIEKEKSGIRKPSPTEAAVAEEQGVIPPRQRLQRLVDIALAEAPQAHQFVAWLEKRRVGVRANVASTGKLNGFSFQLDGASFKGADLGGLYKLRGLIERGLQYSSERDSEVLKAAASRASDVALAKPLPAVEDISYQNWKAKRIEANRTAFRGIVEHRAQTIQQIRDQGNVERKLIRADSAGRTDGSRAAKALALSNQRLAQVLAETQARDLAIHEVERYQQTRVPIGYRDYLADLAQAGSLAALSKLRNMPNTRKVDRVDAGNKINTAPNLGVRPVVMLPTQDWLSRNGITSMVDPRTSAVSYFQGGQLLLVDQRYTISTNREDRATVALQLDMAIKKFGVAALRLSGSDKYIEQAIRIAASDRRFVGVSFDNQDHQSRVEAYRKQMTQENAIPSRQGGITAPGSKNWEIAPSVMLIQQSEQAIPSPKPPTTGPK